MKLTERFNQALSFALELHSSQYRKDTEIPYFSHLIAVASLVLEHGGNEDQAIAALLHDAIEDQAESYGGLDRLRQTIQTVFGEKVLTLIEACTDADTIPKPPWKERKVTYIKHLETVPEEALLISVADKLHNARCILADYRVLGELLWSRFQGSRADIVWYYTSLLKLYKARNAATPSLLSQLEEVVQTLAMLVNYAALTEDCGINTCTKQIVFNQYGNYTLAEVQFKEDGEVKHWNFAHINGCNLQDVRNQLLMWYQVATEKQPLNFDIFPRCNDTDCICHEYPNQKPSQALIF